MSATPAPTVRSKLHLGPRSPHARLRSEDGPTGIVIQVGQNGPTRHDSHSWIRNLRFFFHPSAPLLSKWLEFTKPKCLRYRRRRQRPPAIRSRRPPSGPLRWVTRQRPRRPASSDSASGPPGVPYCATKRCCACGKVAFSDSAAFRCVICVAAVASI